MNHLDHHEHDTEVIQNDTEWNVEGMTCAHCAATVTKFLEKRGMKNVFVDFSSGTVKFDPSENFNREEIIRGIETLGYKVAKADGGKEASFRPLASVESKFFFCLAFTIPLLLHMFLPFRFLQDPVVQLLLCIPVYLVNLFYFGKSAWGSLREGVPNMDVLIFIGSSAAFIYSLTGAVFLHNHDYLFF